MAGERDGYAGVDHGYRIPHHASHTRTGHSHTAAAAEYIDAGSECASRQARRLMIWAVMSGGLFHLQPIKQARHAHLALGCTQVLHAVEEIAGIELGSAPPCGPSRSLDTARSWAAERVVDRLSGVAVALNQPINDVELQGAYVVLQAL